MARGNWLASVSALAMVLACPAHAADLPLAVKAPPAAEQSWTGFYIGTYVGSGLVSSRFGPTSSPLGGAFDQDAATLGPATGALIGSQLGYNVQSGPYVIGLEGDVGTGFLYGQARCGDGWMSICATDTKVLATLAARLGYAVDNVLLYGKAGAAFIDTRTTASGTFYPGQFTASKFEAGWTVGGGVEVALTPQMSAKVEYAYLDFGSTDLNLQNGPFDETLRSSTSAQMVKLGLNWRPWGPPLPGSGAAPPVPGRDWSGVYIGAHAGGAWGRDDWTDASGFLAQASADGSFPGGSNPMGLLGGVQAGFNVQSGPWVAGLEASISAADINGYAKCAADGSTNFVCHDAVSSLGSLSGRIGQSWGDLLLYGKAGAAFVRSAGEVYDSISTTHYSQSGTRWGWMLGSGLEYALSQNVSAFIEYNYYDFGTQDLTYAAGATSATASFRQRLEAVRMGLNTRFAWGGSDAPVAKTAPKLPGLPMGWTAEIGARAFASTGRMQKDLMDAQLPPRLNSRLIYGNTTGQSAETFFRFENQDGLFLKGYAGLGTLTGGSLNDEDFPLAQTYSNTLTDLHDGQLAYGAVDLGYELLRQNGSTIGAFIGYRGFYQSVNGFGCRQIAGDPTCDPAQVAQIPALAGSLGLSETESWQAVAVGLNSRLALADRLRLEVDAAYLPYATRASTDNHWFRPDINPLVENGHGWGTQLEAVLSYAVTDRLSVGLGGRYWYFTTNNASTPFPMNPQASPLRFYSERYGAFLQASYLFGDIPPEPTTGSAAGTLPTKAAVAPVSWSGAYLGGNFGGGKGHSTYATPFAPPVSGDAADLGGATAGVQLGADYQFGSLVVGAEASAGWANIVGTNTCFSTAPAGPDKGFNCGSTVNALGTATARLGYAFDKALVYARGGFAWDRQTDSFNTFAFNGRILSQESTNTGWTLGAGVEYALLPNLAVGLEYKHFDFGASSAFTSATPPALAGVDLAPDGLRLDLVAMTLNYRFVSFAGTP